ncbi:MAG: type II toxin-antitoxin system VapC family toxin [Thermodesulfobacteriota bacterium]|nr:type II toxin-antitoxin system VapC family toxin [Thermodesulfobacteriota bacterium]
MILLDTNILSEPMRSTPDSRVIDWLNLQPVNHLFISSTTQAEVEFGIAILPNGKKKKHLQAASKALLVKFSNRCLPFGCAEASIYAYILAVARKQGLTITREDGQIAAISLANNFTLATRNIKDFTTIPDLQLFNPFDY